MWCVCVMQLLTISAISTLYSSNTVHTLQIYEWCQYMVLSGCMCQANLTSVPDISPPGTVYLSNEEISLLDALYAKNHSRYNPYVKLPMYEGKVHFLAWLSGFHKVVTRMVTENYYKDQD